MATQQDLQELLRLQTARKMPMKDAMAQIKALQSASLRSVQQIADAPLKTVEGAIEDAKAARSLQNACKAHLKRKQASPTSAGPTAKRPAAGTGSASQEQASKRARLSAGDGYMLGPTEVTPAELEASLSLPLNTDEDRIAETALQTNRAPLVLAFAVELLRHTMPEQPPSSRLSLAQAVVSANSRSKAVSLGLDKGPSADEEGWGEGQPRIKVMGREIAVLKRGGYQWKGEEEERAEGAEDTGTTDATPREPDASASTLKAEDDATQATSQEANPNTWTTSPSVSLKQSTFVARATSITDPSQRPKLLKSLFEAQPGLRGASHNVWAYRIHPSEKAISNHPREASHDDGESGAGELLSRILRETSSIDTLVVMTRWYGGVMLGPDRWRLMRNAATQALSERMRRTGIQASLGGEAVWGLDLEGIKSKSRASAAAAGGGMLTHRPEAARNYLLKIFASAPAGGDAAAASAPTAKKKTVRAENAEREENLGLLLGALRLLFDSWADFLSADELDRRAWGWYVAARPDVDPGPSGWGAKGTLRLKTILDLRRKAS